jgi:hypothetical protein
MTTTAGETAPAHAGSLGLLPPVRRPSVARALAGLSASIVLRLLREGLVVRALAWPGLLTALSLFVSAAVTIAWRQNPVIYVSDASMAAPLEAAHFLPIIDPAAAASLADGRAERAVWREDGRLVLGVTWGGTLTTKAEGALRDAVGERWRIESPPPQKSERDRGELRLITGAVAGIVGLLFTLYGVVIAAGSLYRDRSSGVLESDLALPVERWLHAAARLVALSVVLGPALAVSLWIVDALLPISDLPTWMFADLLATLTGGALGVALMARANAGRGFSGPLSQALTASMALISFGYVQPAIGRFLPLTSLGAMFAGQDPSWVIVPVALAASVVVCADFHRRECA